MTVETDWPQAAVVQMVSVEDPDQNMQQLRDVLASCPASEIKLLVLPENFIAYGNPDYRAIAEREAIGGSDSFLAQLKQLCRERGLWIVAGTLPLLSEDDDRPWAACLVIDHQGQVVARYDKIHLFDASVKDAQARYQESAHYRPGRNIVVVDSPVGRLGLAVCYDLRFPELFTAMAEQGAEVIALPSAFTWVTGQAHWQPLLQARSIETGCYVLAAGQGGQHNEKRRTWGHSQILDPWGRVLAERRQDGPGIEVATINLDRLLEARQALPVAMHRKARKDRLNW